ncbi:MAG: hypothetical protein QY331_04885 [Melioribacteraceae bacterium]|jgi:hypothetical protein|nr:hypothetical protein [Melioribacteraceae bacterium]RJP61529.1 MAG: hypothetical protein C4543_03240 [Ignavibacteriales bacterium]WKZ70588.1 MAG: hypothetical protein QY331_04885 [Melioribacteraceae bacterium]
MKKYLFTLFLSIICTSQVYSQEAEVEVFVIDSYVTQEKPYKFILSLFTTESVTSSVTIEDKYIFTVSDTLAVDHRTEIDISEYNFDSSYVKFFISGFDSLGNNFRSDTFEVVLPFENTLKSDKNTSLLTVCCFGGIIFGLPSPTLVINNNDKLFSLVKEIPILSFYSGGYNYPSGYFSLEYAHIFNADFRNYLRVGYKHIFEIPVFEYISPGVSGFTTFEGFNGVSPEITIGWFKVYNAFTVYSKYRFNFQPSVSERNFHEISIGLYSNFFSLNL